MRIPPLVGLAVVVTTITTVTVFGQSPVPPAPSAPRFVRIPRHADSSVDAQRLAASAPAYHAAKAKAIRWRMLSKAAPKPTPL